LANDSRDLLLRKVSAGTISRDQFYTHIAHIGALSSKIHVYADAASTYLLSHYPQVKDPVVEFVGKRLQHTSGHNPQNSQH
jgi:hypothetical protein